MTKPSILIIPGSFSPTGPYEPLADSLISLDYDTYVLPLQTVGRRPSPAPNMHSDAALIATEAEKLISKGRNVVIIAHSYGGVPMTQCVQNLTVRERSAKNLAGGIAHLIYIAAQAPEVGTGLVGEDLSYLPKAVLNGTEEYIGTEGISEGMATRVFNEWSEEKAREAVKVYQPQAAAMFFDRLTWPGYDFVECTYVLTTLDQIAEPKVQRESIRVLMRHAPRVHVVEFESGHCPMITRLEAFVETVKGILESQLGNSQ